MAPAQKVQFSFVISGCCSCVVAVAVVVVRCRLPCSVPSC